MSDMEMLELLQIKDIVRILKCSVYTARKIRNDISEHFNISKKRITLKHLYMYLNLKSNYEHDS